MANTAHITDREDIEPLEPGEIESDGAAIAAASEFSWIDQVRKERDERVAVESLRVGMPTWGDPQRPDLVVEFHVVPRPVLERFQREAAKARKKGGGPREASDYDIAFLVESATAVYLRRPTDEKLVKLKKGDDPIRLDKRLGDMLQLDEEQNKNSRTLLMYLVKDNGVALGNLAMTVARWISNTSATVEDEVLEDVLEG